MVSVKASVGVTPRAGRVSTVVAIATLSVGTVGEITPADRCQGPGPVSTHCPAIVQAFAPFWHWYKPVEVEQNELAVPVVGGVVEQAEMPEPELPPDGKYCAVAETAKHNSK